MRADQSIGYSRFAATAALVLVVQLDGIRPIAVEPLDLSSGPGALTRSVLDPTWNRTSKGMQGSSPLEEPRECSDAFPSKSRATATAAGNRVRP